MDQILARYIGLDVNLLNNNEKIETHEKGRAVRDV
jgi:hypothetical protein